MEFLKNEKTRWFLIGVAAATAGVQFLKSKTVKNGCVKAIAGGMKLKNEAAAAFDQIKEDAQDMCYDAEQSCADETKTEA